MAPGDYVYHFKVALVDYYGATTGDVSEMFDVTLTLVDPCDPPQSIKSSALLEDQKYIITDDPLVYEFASSAVIVPSFCPFEADEPSFSPFQDCNGNANNAVQLVSKTETHQKIKIDWKVDLSPMKAGG